MLTETISWCGKLANQAEFVIAHRFPDIEKNIMAWFVSGQNHLGEQLLNRRVAEQNIFIYYFHCNCFSIDRKPIQGIFLKSQDKLGRTCPFIIFSVDNTASISDILNIFMQQFCALKYSLDQFKSNISDLTLEQYLRSQIIVLDPSLKHSPQYDLWVELYPQSSKLELRVKQTDHIVYRKLMYR